MQPDGLIRVLSICRMGSAGGATRVAEGKISSRLGKCEAQGAFFGPFFWLLLGA